MATITENELLLVSKAKLEKLKNFADGVSLSKRSRTSIERLKFRVSKDRVRLAQMQLDDAIRAVSTVPASSRTAVSRAYYAMYHAARAVTYIAHGGDDHEEHSVLPGKMPADLPNAETWRNKLKNARYERNRADYDPYPQSQVDFADVSAEIIQDAKDFLRVSKKYINSKALDQ